MLAFIASSLVAVFVVSLSQVSVSSLTKISALRESDRRLGGQAQRITSELRLIYQLNLALSSLYLACPAISATGAGLAALRAQGETLRLEQERRRILLEVPLLRLRWQNRAYQHSALRRLPAGPCSLPGRLEVPGEIFLKTWNTTSGVSVHFVAYRAPHWEFFHPRVQVL